VTRRSRMEIGPPELQQLVTDCWLAGLSEADTARLLCGSVPMLVALRVFYNALETELNCVTRQTVI
jgi:hypothetical protein